MNGLICVIKELLFRLKLYVFGVRFYSRGSAIDAPVIYEAEYRIDEEHFVKFKFYRIECFDVVMKRGMLIGESYPSFVVQAFLNDRFPEEIKDFNEKCFFFNGRTNSFGCSEQQSVELILDIYLDFLKTSFKKRQALSHVKF